MLTLVETPLTRMLHDRIAAYGPITVADFMQCALYDSDHGYYTTRDPIGAQGDFITAPEISQIFGELIGLWALETLRQQQPEAPLRLIELGPGHGTLAHDMARTLTRLPGMAGHDPIFDLVEISPSLRACQRERLRDFAAQVRWFDHLAAVPSGPAIMIGNEFLDALPIRQFVRQSEGAGLIWREIMLGHDAAGRLDWLAQAVDPAVVPDWARDLPEDVMPVGSVVESCPMLPDLINLMAARLHESGGAVLLIDYGYDASRDPRAVTWASTLQAMFRHKHVDPLAHIGTSDLTAHVDFGAIVRCARAAGLAVTGPMPQGQFLQSLGGDYRCQQLMARNPDHAHDILTRYRRLITPAQMGHLFKVVILTSPLHVKSNEVPHADNT